MPATRGRLRASRYQVWSSSGPFTDLPEGYSAIRLFFFCCFCFLVVVLVMGVSVGAMGVAVLELFLGGFANAADGDVEMEHFAGQRVIGIDCDFIAVHLDHAHWHCIAFVIFADERVPLD